MKGRRIYFISEDYKPGDYCKLIDAHGEYKESQGDIWVFITPNGLRGRINTKIWNIIEHEDNTITVSPSIKVTGAEGYAWHGYLKHGVWSEC